MSRYDWSFARAAGLRSKILAISAIALLLCLIGPATVLADEAQTIWAPGFEQEGVPQSSCYFRKSFNLDSATGGELAIAADDQYELFLNGRRVGSGDSDDGPQIYDVSRYLLRGRNVVAVKVTNVAGDTAGLAMRIEFESTDDRTAYVITDKTWLTNTRPLPLWYLRIYGDRGWRTAQSFGTYRQPEPELAEPRVPAAETAEPHLAEPQVADAPLEPIPAGGNQPTPAVEPVASSIAATERKRDMAKIAEEHGDFTLAEGFAIELVMDRTRTGSLIAMTFNEFNEIVCSREDGPLLKVVDTDKDTIPDTIRVWCDKVKNCQGLLALNGEVFAVGDGPQGPALYRISDDDRDGTADTVAAVLRFTDEMSEHGPHGVVLGPDGLLYVVLGNHSAPAGGLDAASAYRNSYEGDLVQPRLEDSFKHAFGIKAPGGMVIRTNITGDFAEVVAGGLRNPYDLAFNTQGELFTGDNDMQWDRGLPWYRPTRINLVVDGAEFGWRSGWAKWPDYFVDSLPGVGTTGSGAPSGMVFYEHFTFPKRFHGALFVGDWQNGRIVAVNVRRKGAGYEAASEVFAEGKPMNVTDVEVGPDGGLYFVTGGRGTPGGLYRIVWEGEVPEKIRNIGSGMSAAIRQPQLQCAASRQKVAALMLELGDKWGPQLASVAKTDRNPPSYRIRALDLMQLFGPVPEPELLLSLSREDSPELRAKAATAMGFQTDATARERLVELLGDKDALVRRKACEALLQAQSPVWTEKLDQMLASTDRFEAWTARRMLERIDPAQWQNLVFSTRDHRTFVQMATALLIVQPDKATAQQVAERVSVLLGDFITDRDFLDILRVTQLAFLRGELTAEDVPQLRDQLAEEFPSGNALLNRELIRLLTYLNVTSIADRYIAQLESDLTPEDGLHLALHLARLKTGWTTEQKFVLLEFYERAMAWDGGRSHRGYVLRAAQDFAECLSKEEKLLLLAEGDRRPNAAFAVLSQFPQRLDAATVDAIERLDRKLVSTEGETFKRLKIGVVAVLTRSGDQRSVKYLHEVFDRDPDRRNIVALGLAQLPGDDHWEYLVRSLPTLQGVAAISVVEKLAQSDRVPEAPAQFRDLIDLGLALQGDGSKEIVQLLRKWSGEKVTPDGESWDKSLATWRQWFVRRYPEYPSLEPSIAESERPAAEVARQPGATVTE